jgi:small subunit ribosomal protein S2|tara:strand:+ start:2577 stop:3344 length:768 start_codon:yes stop_codon:yes gene_type:complete
MGATTEQLLEAGVHFGHLTSKWNPKMAPYIFMEQNGIHIIDLNKTASKLDEAQSAIANIARTGRKVMFVATKKQAKEIIEENAKKVNMPFVSQRWLGGMLTNFATVRKSIKKMQAIEKMKTDGTFDNMNKKERLMKTREQEKLIRVLGGIEDLNRLPAALFVVDVKREHIAVKEAQKLNIPIFAIVDTNSDPTKADYPIPGNDDSAKSLHILITEVTNAIAKGLQERAQAKEQAKKDKEETEEVIADGTKTEAEA